MATFRKIGVLTSGGDAPGMSACVKAVVNKAFAMGFEVIGIKGGYAGLIQEDLFPLTNQHVNNVVSYGGTFLHSSRCLEFKEEAGVQRAVEVCKKYGIDALICIGGDGTFRGATDMTNHGIPSIGLPATIDNDITATDNTIGFDTAINTTLWMVDNLRDTCESHARLNVVEVMGRDCGLLALNAAIATGAVAVAVPELPFDEDAAIEKIRQLRANGKRSMIVVVSEGMFTDEGKPYAEKLAKTIQEKTGVETKFTRFGHVVRGGSPTAKDRILASNVACEAIEYLVAGGSNVVMCELNGAIVPVDINFALKTDMMYKKRLKPDTLNGVSDEDLAKMKAICEQRSEELRALYERAGNVAF